MSEEETISEEARNARLLAAYARKWEAQRANYTADRSASAKVAFDTISLFWINALTSFLDWVAVVTM